jgi:excisionase family DNA binding protein
MSEAWVAIDNVANHLGVVRASIYRWIKNNNLPAHRVGRHWKFKISEVDTWVERGARKKKSKPKK